MKCHVEPIYGFYHGQDPRTFSPDGECCTKAEMDAHKTACAAADAGTWADDDSGCHSPRPGVKVLKSSFGLGVYHVVMTDDGEFLRDATYEDFNREGDWEESL
jgi:hypothetical protein